MTYGEVFEKARELVPSKFECGELFYHVMRKKIYHLPVCKEKAAPQNEVDLLLKLCKKRNDGFPLQYLLGEWEFYSLPFKVGKGVLIPRADTETLVDVALDCIKNKEKPRVLDLCSGSGCIAISIAKNRSDAKVTALEISPDALKYLMQNIKLNEVEIEVEACDLLRFESGERFDLIVSNPPYIPEKTIATLQKEVSFEPFIALNGGKDGLDFYRAIASAYYARINDGGSLCFEVGIGQSNLVSDILKKTGFENIKIENDFNNIPRVVCGYKLCKNSEK